MSFDFGGKFGSMEGRFLRKNWTSRLQGVHLRPGEAG